MSSKPRRRRLRDRIRALFGLRSQPRLNSLFTDDLPQNHMQWMEEPGYLSYVQSLESHLQSDTTPSTSKAPKESEQLGNNAGLQSTTSLHKSSSFMSLCHWTSAPMSPLELFYCATVAPFDVDHLSEGQTVPEERTGRPCCSRKKGASTVSLRNIKSDLDCTSRFLVPFDNSRRLHVDDLSNEILQSPHDKQFLERGEACVRQSMKTTNRKTNESYKIPVNKDKLHNDEDVEAGGTTEAGSLKGRVRLSEKKDACPGCNVGKKKMEGSDVAIRFCGNQVALTLKESCKQIVIRCKNGPRCCHDNEGGVDCNNVIRVDRGKNEELTITNKANISISFEGDCIIVNINMPSGESLSKDSSKNESFSKPSSEFQETDFCQVNCAYQSQKKKADDGCGNESKEVQTDILESEGIKTKPGSMPLSLAFFTAEQMERTAKIGEASFQSGHFQKDCVSKQVKNDYVSGGNNHGQTVAENDSISFQLGRYRNHEFEVLNSDQEERHEGEVEVDEVDLGREEDVNASDNEEIDGLSEWYSAIAVSQCHVDGQQCHLTMPSESEYVTADNSLHLDFETGPTRPGDAMSPTSQLPDVGQCADNIAGASTAQHQHSMSDKLEVTRGSVKLEETGGSVTLDETGGNDKVDETRGSVKLEETRGSVKLDETAGSVKLEETAGSVKLEETGGSVKLEETGGRGKLDETRGSDKLDETRGSVKLEETRGSDKLEVTRGSDKLDETRGSDKLEVTGGSDKLEVTRGSDKLEETRGSDKLEVTGGSDKLDETRGSDKLEVTGGSDKLDETGVSVKLDETRGSVRLDETGGSDRCQENQPIVFCVDETGMEEAFLLVQIPYRHSSPGVQVISNYRPRHETIRRLQRDLGQIERELDECRLQLDQVNKCISALKREVSVVRYALTMVCNAPAMPKTDKWSLRTLAPICYKKYQQIRSRAEAKYTLQLVRDHVKALSDLEVLIYRKHLVLLHVLPEFPEESEPQPKRGCTSSYKALNSKQKDQAENGQEQEDNVVIEIVSVTAEINVVPTRPVGIVVPTRSLLQRGQCCSNETADRCSYETVSPSISTLLLVSSDGAASSHYLTDTEV